LTLRSAPFPLESESELEILLLSSSDSVSVSQSTKLKLSLEVSENDSRDPKLDEEVSIIANTRSGSDTDSLESKS